ncbi:MAG: hypothetical protein HYT11_02740 [Candidatus Levybacteria bacterium]|nr:hypothetical protein [Candidatus Levybacteria bacterium]
MLQVIINGQHALKREILERIDKVDRKLDGKIDSVEKNLVGRIDKLGRQLAYLEDDTPTNEEFNALEKRVDKIERKSTPAL